MSNVVERFYFDELIWLKTLFLSKCYKIINNSRECNKIWSRWIISQISNYRHSDIFPFLYNDEILFDRQTIKEIVDNNATYSEAYSFYIEYCSIVKKRLSCLQSFKNKTTYDDSIVSKLLEFTLFAYREIPKKHISNYRVTIDYNGNALGIPSSVYTKLLGMYTRKQDFRYDMVVEYNIWKLLFYYEFLDRTPLQWALPVSTFDEFNCIEKIQIIGELFASPINVKCPIYYSLFDHDKLFGSRGNFFDNYKNLDLKGTYEINPPFIESIFVKSSLCVIDMLTRSKNAINDPLTFIYVMPDWITSIGYETLRNSIFFRGELVANDHSYYDYYESRIVKSRIKTHLLILSTDPNIKIDTIGLFVSE